LYHKAHAKEKHETLSYLTLRRFSLAGTEQDDNFIYDQTLTVKVKNVEFSLLFN